MDNHIPQSTAAAEAALRAKLEADSMDAMDIDDAINSVRNDPNRHRDRDNERGGTQRKSVPVHTSCLIRPPI